MADRRDEQLGDRIDAARVRAIAAAWNIHDVEDIEDLGGSYNVNISVRGSSRHIVIRVRPPWMERDRLLAVHEFRHEVARRSALVPEPLATVDGSSLLRDGGRWVEADTFAPGRVARCPGDEVEVLRSLARLHDVARDLGALVPPPVEIFIDRHRGHLLLRRTKDTVGEHPLLDEVSRLVDGLADDAPLPLQLIHGDPNQDNFLVDDQERCRAILDFDMVALRPRAYDVAFALRAQLGAVWEPTRLLAAVSSYQDEASVPLEEVELRALAPLGARRGLYFLCAAGLARDPLAELERRRPYLEEAKATFTAAEEIAALLLPLAG